MPSSHPRREFLAAVGGSLAAAWLATSPAELHAAARAAHRAATATPPEPFAVLTPAQAADVEAYTAQLIPTDDTPGAREAHVVWFVDKSFTTFAREQHAGFVKEWGALVKRVEKAHGKGKTFAGLAPEQQVKIIAAMEKKNEPFFHLMRGAAITGMFANPEYGGNFEKAGWKLLGFSDQFSWAPPFGWYDANAR